MSMLRRPSVNIGPTVVYNEEGLMPIVATKDEYREDVQGIRRKISKGTVVSRALFPDYEGDDVATRDVHVSSVDPDANTAEAVLPAERTGTTGSAKRTRGDSGSGSGSGSSS